MQTGGFICLWHSARWNNHVTLESRINSYAVNSLQLLSLAREIKVAIENDFSPETSRSIAIA
jgi:hypothetical protein